MTKNPFINAVCASLYITAIASFIFYGSKFFSPEDTILAPIAMISLFTLSAAVMGYLFLYQPLVLFLEGEKKHAINLFLQTLMFFAGITILVFVFIFLKPKINGTTHTTSKTVVKPPIVDHFACGDDCSGPREQYMVKIYQGIEDEEACRKIGGKPYSYVGWGTTHICLAE